MKTDLIIGGREYRVRTGIVRTLALYDELIDYLSDPESVVDEIHQRALAVDLLTFLQRPGTAPKFPYFMQWDNLAVVKISTYAQWFDRQIHKNSRNKIRKAEKSGVVVAVESFSDKLAAGLVGLFNETAVRRGKRNVHYGWDLEKVKREWATELDRSHWLVAYHDDELIGFIKLVLGDGIARTSGTLAKGAHRDKAPMNALFSKAVEVCISRGVPLLVYGKFSYGQKGEDSLTVFKTNNGFQRVDVPRFYVPVSARGRLALWLGLHQGLPEVIPRPLLRVLLNMRSKWYAARGLR
jgi:Acetyltransferase (GNAT) domain